jgi:hypothetical protein
MSNFTKKKILHRKKTNRNKRRQTGSGGKASRISPTTSSTPPTPTQPSAPTPPPASDAIISRLEIQINIALDKINRLIDTPSTKPDVIKIKKKIVRDNLLLLLKIRNMSVFQNNPVKLQDLLTKISDIKKKIIDTKTPF